MSKAVTAWVIVALALFALAGCGDDKAAEAGPTAADKSALKVEDLGEGDQPDELDLDVKGPVQVNYRRITLPPGSGTGKHCHYGELIAVVEKGVLTHYAPIYPNGVHKYKAGESIHEGSRYVHEGKNEGDENVVLLVTYVTPEGKPLSEVELDRCESS